jgi:UDP-galactopyranose mutase
MMTVLSANNFFTGLPFFANTKKRLYSLFFLPSVKTLHTASKPDVIVIGAGLAGVVFARLMAESGRKVVVIEKRPHTGGNMHDENINDIFIHSYGPHIFHTNNFRVVEYLKQFSEWYDYKHHVLGRINNQFVPIPFNFTSIDMLFDKQKAEKLKTLLLAYFKEDDRISVFDLLKHDEPALKEFGQFVYEKIFKNYTAKQWGIPVDKVDISTINRVPVVTGYDNRYFSDKFQMMPVKGFSHLFNKILSNNNITILLNTNAKDKISFDFNQKKLYFENTEYNGILFITGAIDELLDYRYGVLPYRSLKMDFEHIDCEWYQDASVVNYPNDEMFTRITEFKRIMPREKINKINHTTILKEYPAQHDPRKGLEPYYPVINEINTELYTKYVRALEIFDNIYLCGRLAEYKYYNMDTVIERAMHTAELIQSKNKDAPINAKCKILKEFIFYGIIGSCCAGLDSLVFFILRKVTVNLYAANFIGINTGIIASFLLNTFINFKMTDKLLKRAIMFFSVGYAGLLLSMAIMYTGVEIFFFKEIFVKFASVFLVALFQFSLHKLITYRKTGNG